MTAATSASTSASAVIRSRSRASMTTMSPAPIRRSSRSMSRSTRAVPVTPGRELAVRVSSADIFMGLILSRNESQNWEARRNTSHIGTYCHICNTPGYAVRGRKTEALIRVRICASGVEELTGVCPAAVGFAEAGQHARQFGHAVVIVEAAHPTRLVAAASAVHDEVDVGIGSNLREVGDDDDLVGAGEPGQAASDLHSGASTHPGIDL